MTIYIVQEVYYDWYRFDTVVGVFSDEDKAKEFARAKANESKYGGQRVPGAAIGAVGPSVTREVRTMLWRKRR